MTVPLNPHIGLLLRVHFPSTSIRYLSKGRAVLLLGECWNDTAVSGGKLGGKGIDAEQGLVDFKFKCQTIS